METSITPPPLPLLKQLGMAPAHIRNVQPVSRRTHCRAAVNWLTKYHPQPTVTNLDQVKGYLEAFHHLCAIQAWERAFTLISTRLNTPTQEMLHYQLKLWGYSQIRTELYKTLAERLNHRPPDG